jgi:hypothetical protein
MFSRGSGWGMSAQLPARPRQASGRRFFFHASPFLFDPARLRIIAHQLLGCRIRQTRRFIICTYLSPETKFIHPSSRGKGTINT